MRPGFRRAARLTLWAAVGVVVLALALLTLALSKPGEAWLRRFALAQVDGLIAGKVELGALELSLGGRVHLGALRLLDPQGRPVLTVRSVDLKLDPLALLGRRLALERLDVEAPQLTLLTGGGPGGSNLARALAPRHPSAGPSAPGKPWRLKLDALTLHQGLIDARARADDPHAFHAEAIALAGGASDVPGALKALLHLEARLTAPEQTPLLADLDLEGTGLTLRDRLEVRKLSLVAGQSTLGATATLEDGGASATLALTLTQALGQALGLPLERSISARGEARWADEGATLSLKLPDARGSLALEATVHPRQEPLTYEGALTFDAFDPSATITGAPAGAINGTVAVDGAGTTLDALTGEVTVSLGKSSLAGMGIDGLSAQAHLAHRAATLEKLTLSLPGATLTGHGTASLDALDLQLTARAPSLAALTHALGVEPAWAGEGRGTLHLSGSPRAPRVEAVIDGSHLASEAIGLQVVSAHIEGKVPDLARPSRLHAHVGTGEGQLQSLSFRALDADLDFDGRRFTGTFASVGHAAARVLASGELPDRQGVLTLSTLRLELPGAAWSLVAPARIELAKGIRVDRAELAADAQRLVLSGGVQRRKLDARVSIAALDLARLPAFLLPAHLGLAGTLGGTLTARGTLADPLVDASLQASEVALLGATGLQATLQATLQHRRVKGQLSARLQDTTLALSADAPISLARADAPLTLTLSAKEVDLALASRLAGQAGLATGQVRLAIDLGGTVGQPTGTLDLGLHAVSVHDLPPLDGTAKLTLDQRATLALDLGSQSAKLAGTVALTLPEDPLHALREVSELLALPADAKLTLSGVELQTWRTLLHLPEDAAGQLDLALDAHGTARAPEGTLRLTGRALALGAHQNGEGTLKVVGGPKAIEVTAALKHLGQPVLKLDGKVGRSVQALWADPGALGSLPVDALVTVGPYTAGDPLHAHGTLSGQAKLTGTLDAPEVHASFEGRALAVAQSAVGEGAATLTYQRGRATLALTLPQLKLDARADQELGLAAVKKGIDPQKIPLSASLHADHLDLGLLAGISSEIRTVGGTLVADASVAGTLGDPTLRGTVDVSDGRLVLVGFGDYRNVKLHADLDDAGLRLTQLDVQAGAGSAHLTATALRGKPGSPYAVQGTLSTERFPVMFNDQTVATVQAAATVDGEVIPGDALVKVHFTEVHADVPSLTRKDVQPLAPNPDVVILGQTRRTAKKKAAAGAAGPSAPSEAFKLRLGLYAPGDFWVRGQDINLDLRANVGVQLQGGELEIIEPPGLNQASMVEVIRGKLEVFGRRFDIPDHRPARLVFQGGPPEDATLDAAVVYNDRTDNIVVTVNVNGPLLHPNPPTLTSDPPMDPSKLALLIATGHLDAKRGSAGVSGTSGAASVVGSLVASQLQKSLSARLPLDTLSIESVGQGAARIEAGVYITDKIYVGYTHNIISGSTATQDQQQNLNEVSVQYTLSRRWQLEASGGDQGAGGIDAVWSKDY